jgi:hypothetical protein
MSQVLVEQHNGIAVVTLNPSAKSPKGALCDSPGKGLTNLSAAGASPVRLR